MKITKTVEITDRIHELMDTYHSGVFRKDLRANLPELGDTSFEVTIKLFACAKTPTETMKVLRWQIEQRLVELEREWEQWAKWDIDSPWREPTKS